MIVFLCLTEGDTTLLSFSLYLVFPIYMLVIIIVHNIVLLYLIPLTLHEINT